MNRLWYIAFCLISWQPVHAQMSGSESGGDGCDDFIWLVEQRNYFEAGRIYERDATKGCRGAEYEYAKALYMVFAGKYRVALGIVTELAARNPKDAHYQAELERMRTLVSASHSIRPISIAPYRHNPKASLSLIAWVGRDTPRLIQEVVSHETYFPFRKEGVPALQIIPDADESSGMADKVNNILMANRYDDVGPGCFMPDSSIILTAVQKTPYSRKVSEDKMKLVHISADAKKLKELPFCRENANFAYPAFCAKQQALIFASDLGGGQGGMDLWKVSLNEGVWSEPDNLGPLVNTEFDEIFPSVYGDSLFFASNTPENGFGGFDVYLHSFAQQSTQNLGLPVNSPYDEHSFIEAGRGVGFLVSNRNGARQVYKMKWSVKDDFFDELSGEIISDENLIGEEVHLLDQEGAILQRAIVGADGKFRFRQIKGQENYGITLPNARLDENDALRLYNSDNKVIKEMKATANGKFFFELLAPMDYYLTTKAVRERGAVSVSAIESFFRQSTRFIPELLVKNKKGAPLAKVISHSAGEMKIELLREEGKVKFVNKMTSNDQTLYIVDEDGRVIHAIEPAAREELITLSLDADSGTITFTNDLKDAEKIAAIARLKTKTVYFDRNSVAINAASKITLDNVIKLFRENPHISLEVVGHADAWGSFETNQVLSELRAQSAIDYLIKQGIPAEAIEMHGFGESKLTNHCKDGIKCSAKEHAANRRVEISLR